MADEDQFHLGPGQEEELKRDTAILNLALQSGTRAWRRCNTCASVCANAVVLLAW